MLQQKNQRMAADGLFYRMLQDRYSFVVYDTWFNQFQVFRNGYADYVVILDVVEGVGMISEVPDWWLRPGKRKFTVDLNSSIATHGKAIWRYVLKRSAKRSKVSLREF